MAIPKRVRFEILRRDDFACFYCNASGSIALHVDHVIPASLGGTDDQWNLVAACRDCNLGKTDGMPTQEMVDRARAAYMSYAKARGWPVAPCDVCGTPIQNADLADDEEPADRCTPCDMAVFMAYLRGGGG